MRVTLEIANGIASRFGFYVVFGALWQNLAAHAERDFTVIASDPTPGKLTTQFG